MNTICLNEMNDYPAKWLSASECVSLTQKYMNTLSE